MLSLRRGPEGGSRIWPMDIREAGLSNFSFRLFHEGDDTMSIGPAGGIAGSAAGAPLQSKGADSDRAAQEATAQQRQVDSQQAAEKASGVGQTEEDQETSERDADGRRLWEGDAETPSEPRADEQENPPGGSKDPTGESGNLLDLSG